MTILCPKCGATLLISPRYAYMKCGCCGGVIEMPRMTANGETREKQGAPGKAGARAGGLWSRLLIAVLVSGVAVVSGWYLVTRLLLVNPATGVVGNGGGKKVAQWAAADAQKQSEESVVLPDAQGADAASSEETERITASVKGVENAPDKSSAEAARDGGNSITAPQTDGTGDAGTYNNESVGDAREDGDTTNETEGTASGSGTDGSGGGGGESSGSGPSSGGSSNSTNSSNSSNSSESSNSSNSSNTLNSSNTTNASNNTNSTNSSKTGSTEIRSSVNNASSSAQNASTSNSQTESQESGNGSGSANESRNEEPESNSSGNTEENSSSESGGSSEEEHTQSTETSAIRSEVKELIDNYVEAQRDYAEHYDSAPVSQKLRLYTTVIDAYKRFTRLGRDDSLTPEERQYYSDAETAVSQMYD